MGRHTHQSDHKVAHTALLTLSILSVGSPIGLLMAIAPRETPQEQTEPSIDSLDTDWLALPQGPPELNLSIPIEKAAASPTTRVKHAKATTSTTTPTSTATVTTRAKQSKTPASRPTPTVTTKPNRPTVAQRQIAKAKVTPPTTTTTTKPQAKPVPKAAPKPTTKQQVQVPKPVLKTTPKTLPVPIVKSSTPTTRATTTTTTKPPPPSPPSLPPPQSSVGEKVVSVAKTYVGRNLPYRMGGDSLTTGIDCSHFVWRVLKEAGFSVSYRDSAGLASWTRRATTPQPGDLVLYSGHVGIYAGNGMMVHHGKPGGAFFIKVYKDNFIGYGRMPV